MEEERIVEEGREKREQVLETVKRWGIMMDGEGEEHMDRQQLIKRGKGKSRGRVGVV